MDQLAILNQILGFIIMLYANPMLPRKIVQEVVNYFTKFIKRTFIPSLKEDVLEILRSEQISDYSLRRVNNCFDRHADMFNYVDSEGKRFTLLRQRGLIDEK